MNIKSRLFEFLQKTPKIVLLLLLFFLIRGVIFASTTPVWQAPDEPLHYEYTHHLATESDWPIIGKAAVCPKVTNSLKGYYFEDFIKEGVSPYRLNKKVYAPADYKGEAKHRESTPKYISIIDHAYDDSIMIPNHIAQHPPFYYLITGFLYTFFLRLFSLTFQVWFLRLFSVLLGIFTVYLTYLTAKLLLPEKPFLQYALTAFAALLPMFGYMMSVINNDSLTILLFSGLIYLMVLSLKKGLNRKLLFSISAVTALGLLTKASFAVSIPAVLYVIVNSKKIDLKKKDYLTAAFLAFSIAGWWYARLLIVYGSLLPRIEFYEPAPGNPWSGASLVYFLRKSPLLGNLLYSFWGIFGWLRLRFAENIYDLLKVVTAVMVGGVTVQWIYSLFKPKKSDFKIQVVFSFLIILLLTAIVIPSWLGMRKTGLMEGVQGRYLFPLIIPIGYLVVTGLDRLVSLLNKVRAGLSSVLVLLAGVVGLLIFDAMAIFTVFLPYFYGSGETSSYAGFIQTAVSRLSTDWFRFIPAQIYYLLFAAYVLIVLSLIGAIGYKVAKSGKAKSEKRKS